MTLLGCATFSPEYSRNLSDQNRDLPIWKRFPDRGYSEERLGPRTFRVRFLGRENTSRRMVEEYLLYRCAELTLETGHDYFVMRDSQTKGEDRSYTTTPTYQYDSKGRLVYYDPGQTVFATRYDAVATIELFTGEKPAREPAAFDARDLMKRLGPRIAR